MGVYPENRSRTGWDKRAKKAINENLEIPEFNGYHHKGKSCTHYDKIESERKTCKRGKGHQNREEGRKVRLKMPF